MTIIINQFWRGKVRLVALEKAILDKDAVDCKMIVQKIIWYHGDEVWPIKKLFICILNTRRIIFFLSVY